MKAKLLLIALITLAISSCQAQAGATVYAKNSDISDNLDLRAVASMFGESANLQDFERRLNDPKYQISNLDLNGDNQVDYLRVIESVEDRTHVVIIQAVLDRDVYQDVATIDVERDNYNKVNVQIVGNTYLYGDNYIYEPVYSVVPVIYTSFWVTNYRPYYSTWYWGYYPTYYTAWRPYPVYRYRNNINVCINVHNSYNYVNTRRSYRAPAIYETRRSYGYERMKPNYSFAQRNSNVSNRHDLDQRRTASRESNRSQNTYNTNRSSNTGRVSSAENRSTNRNYNTNRTASDRNYNTNRTTTDRSYGNTNRVSTNSRENSSQVNTAPVRTENTQRAEYGRNNSTASAPRGNSENRGYSNRQSSQTSEPSRTYSENRGSSNRGNATQSAPVQRAESSRSSSESRSYESRPQNTQRSEAPRASQESRSSQPQRESGSSARGGGRRG